MKYYDGECIVRTIVENGLIAKENGGVFFVFVFFLSFLKQSTKAAVYFMQI